MYSVYTVGSVYIRFGYHELVLNLDWSQYKNGNKSAFQFCNQLLGFHADECLHMYSPYFFDQHDNLSLKPLQLLCQLKMT